VELLHRADDRFGREIVDPGDPAERVADPGCLRLELSFVGEILEAAAAADAEMLARRLDANRARYEHLDEVGLGVAALRLRDPRAHRVSWQTAPDEDDEPVQARDTVPAEGERIDGELELVTPLHWRGHDSRLHAEERQAGFEAVDLDCRAIAREPLLSV
jgi:hypothetical protein